MSSFRPVLPALALLAGLFVPIPVVDSHPFSAAAGPTAESYAVTFVRDVCFGEGNYASIYKSGYSETLEQLGNNCPYPLGPACARVLPIASQFPELNSQYKFSYTGHMNADLGLVDRFEVYADPAAAGSSLKHFYTDPACRVRENPAKRAGPNDAPTTTQPSPYIY